MFVFSVFQVNEPRLKVGRFATRLTVLTRKDEGYYSVPYKTSQITLLELKIKGENLILFFALSNDDSTCDFIILLCF